MPTITACLELDGLDVEWTTDTRCIPFTGSPMGAQEETHIVLESVKYRGIELLHALTDREYEQVVAQVEEQLRKIA